MITLGLDIGSNSVGSAWVDTDRKQITLGVSHFPAGVEEREDKRGAPKNQKRRQVRSQRRSIKRRAVRKRRLRDLLTAAELLPSDPSELHKLFAYNVWPIPDHLPEGFMRTPWHLRREGLNRPLHPFEFGRVLVHLNQRRGAWGIELDEDAEELTDDGKVKKAIDKTRRRMQDCQAATFGQMMADLLEQQAAAYQPIRNRRDSFEFHADRALIRDEFRKLWEKQKSFDGELTRLLTDEICKRLDDPERELFNERGKKAWRHGGEVFGQRDTFWRVGTLGRCDLEPTDRCVPIADRHASYFRVVETVNNLRIRRGAGEWEPLTADQRTAVIMLLRQPLYQKKKGRLLLKDSASETDIRRALGIAVRDKNIELNIGGKKTKTKEASGGVDVNTDWFHREIVVGAIGEERWDAMDEHRQERVNRAMLSLDVDNEANVAKLLREATHWWELPIEAAERFIEACKGRPKLEKRLNLSRRAILNLLPYMERPVDGHRWRTQQEAAKAFASDPAARDATTGIPLHELARVRYRTGASGISSSARHFMRQQKHQIKSETGAVLPPLPPAPTLANPVVRKAIHEVRRHIIAYLRKFGTKPDRIIIEFARAAKQSGKVRDAAHAVNQKRRALRKKHLTGDGAEPGVVQAAFQGKFGSLSLNQQRAAVDRVILAQQQRMQCPYCGEAGMTPRVAALGEGVEIEHIVPYSRCGDNGLNNKVLSHIACNRDKGRKTPREWWGDAFDERSRIAQKLFHGIKPEKSDFFTAKDYRRKWQNFVRQVRESEEWRNSQLTDTAYAARQVMAYLADALFDGRGLPERGGERKIFVTHGKYTAMLRRDWQLFERLKRSMAEGEVFLSPEEERALEEKNRGDHRQHAIDAVVIALTGPDIIPIIAQRAAQAEEIHAEHGHWPGQKRKREQCQRCQSDRNRLGFWPGEHEPIEPPKPWRDVTEFRRCVLSKVYSGFERDKATSEAPNPLVVSHRVVSRKLVGWLHKAEHFGPVLNNDSLFTKRINAVELKPAHLREPQEETDREAVARLAERYKNQGLGQREAQKRAESVVAGPGFTRAKRDPPPGKSGIVRDPALRGEIRKCLTRCGINPDRFDKREIKKLVDDGTLRMGSGVPIRRITMLRTLSGPIVIRRKVWDPVLVQRFEENPETEIERSNRVYESQNNHHIEIRTDGKSWTGKVVDLFTAANRVRQSILRIPRKRGKGTTSIATTMAVDRSDRDGRQFVMSLAQGEMVRMRHPKTGIPDYFVVIKLDKPSTIVLAHHADARPQRGNDPTTGKKLPRNPMVRLKPSKKEGRKQPHPALLELIAVSARDLQSLTVEQNLSPYKVRVTPLGKIIPLARD